MHKLPTPRHRANGAIIPPVVKLTTHKSLEGPVWFNVFHTRVYTSGRMKARFRREFGRPERKGQFNATQRRSVATCIRDMKRAVMGTSAF